MEETKEKPNTSGQINKDFGNLEASGGALVAGTTTKHYNDSKLSTKLAKRKDLGHSNRNDRENNEWREDSNDESEMLSGIKDENIMK